MASLLQWLRYSGARKSDGTPVSSGSISFYLPGTTTSTPVYSDADGLVVQTQPVALDAGGRAKVYAKTAVRAEVKDSTGVSVALEDRADTVNASQVEIEQAGITGTSLVTGLQVDGGRTDLQTLLGGVAGFGAGFQYRESSTATARNIQDALGLWVTPQDFGALGNDSADDTAALQAAINRCIAADKGLFIPPGTYRFTVPLVAQGAGVAGLRIVGANRAASLLKNMSTTGNGLVVDLSSAVESHVELEGFTVSASSTSSGTGVLLSNGNGTNLQRIAVAAHRTAIDATAVSQTYLEDCLVSSTDGNAAGYAFRLGGSATAQRCRAVITNGIAFSFEGAFGRACACRAAATTGQGYVFSANDCVALQSLAIGCQTGFSVGAFARSGAILCSSTDATTNDWVTNAATTAVVEYANNFTLRTQNELNGEAWFGTRGQVFARNRAALTIGGNISVTPDPSKGELQVFAVTSASALATITVNATATTGLVDGQRMIVVFDNQTAQTQNPIAWNAQYKVYAGSAGSLSQQGNTGMPLQVFTMIWRASNSTWVQLHFTGGGNNSLGMW